MQSLLGLTLEQITDIAQSTGLRRFAGAQITQWVYPKRATSLEQMTNLSIQARATLARTFEIGRLQPTHHQISTDGTIKYLFDSLQGKPVETVYIPDSDRATLCISSQSGCRMGCRFCMTARGGFSANLSSGEIINQIISIPHSERLTNIVYMGMGEPLDNLENVLQSIEIMTSAWGYAWSPTRITVSTIGVMPALKELLEKTRVHVAVSLHNPFDAERQALMPMQKAYPIRQTVELLRSYDFSHQRRLSFEYIMFDGVNDTPRHLEGLIELLRGMDCRMNLIRFHQIPQSELRGSSDEVIRSFNGALNRAGILTTTRSSRGEDIFAACGMLSFENTRTLTP